MGLAEIDVHRAGDSSNQGAKMMIVPAEVKAGVRRAASEARVAQERIAAWLSKCDSDDECDDLLSKAASELHDAEAYLVECLAALEKAS